MKKRYKKLIIIPIVGASIIISIVVKLILKLPPLNLSSILTFILLVIILGIFIKE